MEHDLDTEQQQKQQLKYYLLNYMGFPGGSLENNSLASTGDAHLNPGSGKSLGKGNGYPFQYSCLENSMDRQAWWTTVHGVAKSWSRLSMHTHATP